MRIVIGEDSTLFREGLTRLLEDAGHDRRREGRGRAGAPRRGRGHTAGSRHHRHPDAARPDRRRSPCCPDAARASARTSAIVLLSQHLESRHSVELVASGHFGYLLKDRVFDVDDFLEALRRVAAGGSALDPEVVATLLGPSRRQGPARPADTARARGPGAHGRRAGRTPGSRSDCS